MDPVPIEGAPPETRTERYSATTDVGTPGNDEPKRVSEADREAVAELYRLHARDLLQRIIRPRCVDTDAADEALAETFRAVLLGYERYESHPAGPFPWLARIAISKTMDVHRARSRTQRAMAGLVRLMHPLLPEAPPADELSRRRDAIALHAEVVRVLGTLRPRYREAIELRFFEELGREACAERMGVTLGNFDVLLLRALRAARAELEAGGASEERT